MSSVLLPIDSFVISQSAAALAEFVDGIGDLLVVRPNGTLAFSRLTAISPKSRERPAWRLLTGVGDILLPDGARTITREGPLTGRSIADRVRHGANVRLEVLCPPDLPIEAVPALPRLETSRVSLGAFSRRVIRIPRQVADSDDIAGGVEKILRSAKVQYRRVDLERWVVLLFDPVDAGSMPGIAHPHEATALMKLTAWESGDPPISRTTLEERTVRRRLLASLASARRPFEVRWGPSYLPVEARVQALDPAERRPFVPIHAALEETAAIREVDLATPGYLVVGLALVGPAAA